jgi:hypothetical protein
MSINNVHERCWNVFVAYGNKDILGKFLFITMPIPVVVCHSELLQFEIAPDNEGDVTEVLSRYCSYGTGTVTTTSRLPYLFNTTGTVT